MILFASKSRAESERFAENFNIMGYLATASTGATALNTLTPMYHALVLINPNNIASADSILYHNSVGLKVPVFALGDTSDKRFLEVFKADISTSSLSKKIIRRLALCDKHIIGKYKCAGFDCSASLSNIFFFDEQIKLTITEKMILRYLTVSYPLPVSAEEIIAHAIRPSRKPEPSAIRTHICSMNKKFKSSLGRPMIEFFDRRGYLLITPDPRRGIR